MRVRPTELGFKGMLLFCALGVAFLAASYSNLFFLILVFCAVLGVLGLWWTVRNARGVTVTVLEAPIAAAGAQRQITISIANGRSAPSFDLTLAVALGGAPVELVHVGVVRGSIRLAATLPELERGVIEVRAMRCASRFPFGLFQVTRTLPVAFELVTFPRALAGANASGWTQGGANSAAAAGRSVEVAGLRPFRAGDSTADVHWKASARRGEPIVKERERAGSEVVEVVLDRRSTGDGPEFEAALSRATALVRRAVDNDHPLQMRSQGFATAIPAGRSVDPVLRWLAQATPLPADAPPPRRFEEAVLA